MKRVCQLFLIFVLAADTAAQKASLAIPELKNLNPKDEYPASSLVAAYAGTFDVLVALREYSNWLLSGQKVTVLAHKENGWFKINIRADYIFRDTSIAKITIIKINNATGDTLWNIFTGNHLFDLEDERTKKMPCVAKRDTIIKNGKQEIKEHPTYVFDGPQYEFEILTGNKYKKVYSYSPQFFDENCKGLTERKWALNCLIAFEKYLGK